MIGETIEHYTVVGKLGEGGMGVVYKGRDTHLDRFVALKLLPPHMVADPTRQKQFMREARMASALNHPNIITVYDIGESDGVTFIAMEWVDGKTLHESIRAGLPLKDVLKFAAQIASALARAHAAGIVHRDLKPSNIMVSSEGRVKVLDFGLAKLTEVLSPDDAAPTLTMQERTEHGVISGTLAYMSPEQAEAKQVDSRSDIFSFGAVLYEMITGRRAFARPSAAATLMAVIGESPVSPSQLVPNLPYELERLTMRCLQKDPERRSQSMGDVAVVLREIAEETNSLPRSASSSTTSDRNSTRLKAMLALPVVLAAGWLAATYSQEARSSRSPDASPMHRLTWDNGLTTDPALSPDGKLLAYSSDRAGRGNLDIWVQQVGGAAPIRLTVDEADQHQPSFSHDGTRIVFRSEVEGGGIYTIPALGGVARKIAAEGRDPRFSPDDKSVAYWTGTVGGGLLARGASVFVCSAQGGRRTQIQPQFAGAAYPAWTPDGNHVMFLGNQQDGVAPEEAMDWWVAPISGGAAARTGALNATRAQKLLGPFQVYPSVLLTPAWFATGDSVAFSARVGDSTNLWRMAITPASWKASGPAQRLTYGPTMDARPTLASVGGKNRIAFASLVENIDLWSLPLGGGPRGSTGEPVRFTDSAAVDFHASASVDNKYFVYLSARSGHQEVWIRNMISGEETQLTATRTQKYEPVLSPDGSQVAFSSFDGNEWNQYVIPATGGEGERVCEGCGAIGAWTADGKQLLHGTVAGQIGLVNPVSRSRKPLLVHPRYRLYQPRFSPDERWMSFMAAERSRARVYVTPYLTNHPIPPESWIELTDGTAWDDKPRWSADGSRIYFTSDRDGFQCVWTVPLHPASKRPVAPPVAVYHSHSSRRSLFNIELGVLGLSVTANGLIFNMAERTGNIWMADLP